VRGDFSRITFRPGKHYSAVLAQQGRVQLDADGNEQQAIQAHLSRTLATDVIGPHAGPAGELGFEIRYDAGGDPPDLTIGGGRYYVDGILCDADRPVPLAPVQADPGKGTPSEDNPLWTYWTQPDGYLDPERESDQLPPAPFLAYLKVWERLVTAVEDPDIQETALGAALPDTAARLRVVWQVLPLRAGGGFDPPYDLSAERLRVAFDDWVTGRTRPAAWLAVRAQQPPRTDEDPCIVHPEARYRGPENQLYRIEVHQGGAAGPATFVWSRENGSVIFPIREIDGVWVTLGSLGRDDKLDLHVGDWTEVVDDASASRGEPAPLLQVVELDVAGRRVQLSGEPGPDTGHLAARHPYLRRWDHRAAGTRGAPGIVEGALQLAEGSWIDLEDGVQVWFATGGSYRPGDYWVVAARTRDGDVEWPRDTAGIPLLAPPHGPRYHYAPLAWIPSDGPATDLRHAFGPLAYPIEHPPGNGH